MIFQEIHQQIKLLANKERAILCQKYFKTGKGEYAEGDVFLGLSVPQVRGIAKQYYEKIDDATLIKCLHSIYHEERLLALCIMVLKFKKNKQEQEKIFNFYIKNKKFINNWDLVDTSSKDIVGAYLINKPKNILYKFAQSQNLWTRRISIISTMHYIAKQDFEDALRIAEILIGDKHDLIHKAVGWVLREIGKKNKQILIDFLEKFKFELSRTTLRYAIEKFEPEERIYFLKKQ